MSKVVVVGVGLIGGSFAIGLKQRNICEVIGVSPREQTRQLAITNGVVDRVVTCLGDVASELGAGDAVFIAVPTLAVTAVLQECCECLSDDVTITDGASVKGSVLAAVEQIYGCLPKQVVLGHPIAGSEKSGVTAANPDLYENHRVILTPHLDNTDAHIRRVTELWQALGAEVLSMPVAEHDDVLAATSHLPHAIAYSLVDTLAHDSENQNIFRYAAGGFKDFTRIASSDPLMWHDIMLANKDSVLKSLSLFTDNLQRLCTAIEQQDSDYLLGVFTRAKSARDHFTTMLAERAYVTPQLYGQIDYIVSGASPIRGSVRVPGDKSISHRAIILGSLAEGVTEIEGFLEGEDSLATLQCMRDMGVVIEGPEDGYVKIHGVGLHGLQKPPGPLYVGNSGTSIRLLAGVLAGQAFSSELRGDASLNTRPMARIAIPLKQMGVSITLSAEQTPPIIVNGGALSPIQYILPLASAQVKSCVLLAGLYAFGDTEVEEPEVTRDHTERMLAGFGYSVQKTGRRIALTGGGRLYGRRIDIPTDLSSAAFFMVAASIVPNSDITLTHVGVNPTRAGVITLLQLMGADISLSNECDINGEPVADIRVQSAPLQGIRIPTNQVSLAIDEFPVLFVAAACAQGVTELAGAEELKVKESDRLEAMANGLKALGVSVSTSDDGIRIEGGELQGGEVDSCGDHRIAMAFAIAGSRAKQPVRIRNVANVATSFPSFADLAQAVGISLEIKDS